MKPQLPQNLLTAFSQVIPDSDNNRAGNKAHNTGNSNKLTVIGRALLKTDSRLIQGM